MISEQENQEIQRGLQVPKFKINLDDSPEKRWEAPLTHFKQELTQVEKIIDQDPNIPKLAQNILGLFKNKVYYIEELKGIAKITGWDLNKILILQLNYEAFANCTSIIGNKADNTPLHARTMEWEMPFLRPLTIEVEFWKNNRPLAICTTWVGYVGILTGMNLSSNNNFSISVNYRCPGDGLYKNIKNALKEAWPIGFLVREVLCDEKSNYEQAVSYLQNSKLISPVYFTVCGSQKNQGNIITRSRSEQLNPLNLNHIPQNFLVQTNIDHWEKNPQYDILNSTGRRAKATELLFQQQNQCSNLSMWKTLSTYPMMSDIVIYGTMMDPSTKFYETRLTVGRGSRLTFLPRSLKQIEKEVQKEKCHNCGTEYYEELNSQGQCKHKGEWHSQYSDCNKIKCAMGLGLKNLGTQHYSCCYSTDINSMCKKSDYHIPQ